MNKWKKLLSLSLLSVLCTAMFCGNVIAEEPADYDTEIVSEANEEMPEASVDETEVTPNIVIGDYELKFYNDGVESEEYTCKYTGQECKPKVRVVYDGRIILNEDEYTLTYENNINRCVKQAIVHVDGKGDYSDFHGYLEFSISGGSIADATVTLGTSTYVYDGSAHKPSVTVKLGGETLQKTTDYTVAYSSNTNAGTAKVVVKGVGDYTGSVTKTFTIKKKSVADCTISLSKTAYDYTGKAIKPTVTMKNGSKAMTKGTDYSVSYKNNTAVGKASVVVKGAGTNYGGSITKAFKIVPSKPTVTSLEHVSTGVKVTWTKSKGAAAYYVYRKVKGDAHYKCLNSKVVTKTTSFVDKTAKTGYTYIYCVKGYTSSYKSVKSNEKSISILAQKPVIKLTKKSNGFTLSWSKVPGVTKYQLYRRISGGSWVKIMDVASASSYTDTAVKSGNTYNYQLVTFAGKIQMNSNIVSGTWGDTQKLPAPTNLALKQTGKSFYSSWNAVTGAQGYQIWWSTNSSFPSSNRHFGNTVNNHFLPQAVYCGAGTWYVKVQAYKIVNGEKQYSPWSSVKKIVIK